MLVKYDLKYSDGAVFNSNGVSPWNTPDGKAICNQINMLVEKYGLIRQSPYRTPETIDLDAAIRFLTACNALSTETIIVECRIICPAEFHK